MNKTEEVYKWLGVQNVIINGHLKILQRMVFLKKEKNVQVAKRDNIYQE